MMSSLKIRQLKSFANAIRLRAAHELTVRARPGMTLNVIQGRRKRLLLAHQGADYLISVLTESALPTGEADDGLVALFEGAREALAGVYKKWRTEGAGEVGKSEVEASLEQLASLHDKLNTLCWLIREHEADQDRVVAGVFSSADDLFTAMGV
ncbi:hypothetical protein [Massilia scottii]|uniref:hypothetical protein n=1 Tax=Massilia scottii TaxID=3057166 RepID=UPI0027964D5A|nr:hypothetical protein [Massilia sp. CCM 9029]MDQ1832261.1 hypothetical protein [Massilia sp. CCM 9029]